MPNSSLVVNAWSRRPVIGLLAVLVCACCLSAQPNTEVTQLVFHDVITDWPVTAIALDQTGTHLAIGGGTGVIAAYDLNSADPSRRYISGAGFSKINSVEFAIQSTRVIVGGQGEVFAAVYTTPAWELEHAVAGPRSITAAHDIGGVLFYLLDASTRQVLSLDMTLRPHVDYVAGSVSLLGHSIDRRRTVLLDQRQVLLLDAATMRALSKTGTMLGYDLTAIGVVGQGYTALIGTSSGDMLILDVLDGRIADTLHHAHNGAITGIEVTERGIFTCGADGSIRHWSSYESHTVPTLIENNQSPIVGIGVSYSGNRIAFAAEDGTIHVRELVDPRIRGKTEPDTTLPSVKTTR